VLVRLQKILSEAGISSRRGAEALIEEGKVRVNGAKVTKLGTKADPDKDTITVNGREIIAGEKKVYLMMNKPTGYVTTMKDPKGRAIVTDLLTDITERVYPVGRLDYDSSGLLIFTNDGEVANRLAHPKHEVIKTYRVKVRGYLTDEQLTRLKAANRKLGFRAPHEVRVEAAKKEKGLRKLTRNSWVVISIAEGKNRQIRRMLDSVGGTVLKLTRISYGKLSLKGLRPASYRHLTDSEVRYLKGI
jgi:23S rRNA pseudouridine2605 synthase